MGKWWVVTDSNRRHSRCKRDALPTELTTRDMAFSGDGQIVQGGEIGKNARSGWIAYLTNQSVIISMRHGTAKIR